MPRPRLNIHSQHLVYLFDAPSTMDWRRMKDEINKRGHKVNFIETFEAWIRKKTENVIIEFTDNRSLMEFIDKLVIGQIFNKCVLYKIIDEKNREKFFDEVHRKTGVDLISCNAIPPDDVVQRRVNASMQNRRMSDYKPRLLQHEQFSRQQISKELSNQIQDKPMTSEAAVSPFLLPPKRFLVKTQCEPVITSKPFEYNRKEPSEEVPCESQNKPEDITASKSPEVMKNKLPIRSSGSDRPTSSFVIVKNISEVCSESDVKKLAESGGNVRSIETKIVAIVEYTNKEAADNAIALLNNRVLNGKLLNAEKSQPDEEAAANPLYRRDYDLIDFGLKAISITPGNDSPSCTEFFGNPFVYSQRVPFEPSYFVTLKNIPENLSCFNLMELAKEAGELVSVMPRLNAIVEYEDQECAQKAITALDARIDNGLMLYAEQYFQDISAKESIEGFSDLISFEESRK